VTVVRTAPIRSRRLDLVSMSAAFVEAVLEGRRAAAARLVGAALPRDWPDRRDLGFLNLRLAQMQKDPETQPWLVRALVLREPRRTMVGHAGFHGPPGVNGPRHPDAVELGYTVFPPFRGRGLATEAVGALLDWASSEHGMRRFVASVAPGNEPSLAIVRKLGFVQTGQQWDDEDGLELVYERTTE
jgi:[ribosomal protein S5]-alanine N-acetyltransferase